MTTATPARDLLTQAEAEGRAARVSNAAYTLHIAITRGASAYRGTSDIRFDLTGSGDLFLDHRGTTIEHLRVNGEEVTPDWTGYRLTLAGRHLREGANEIRIVYQNDYDHTGDGFHQFIDPEDGQEYLYTNFEPYEAHRLFPCFDQPDIKATYAVTVSAPAEWEVIANGRETGRTDAGDGAATRTFETTKPFSTYLFALIAGPYTAYRDEHNGLPLGLYCRGSMAKHFDAEELFTLTKQGFDYFNEFFDVTYPFGKYDQVWVPEFNAGAMENVGAVTHSEHYIFRDPPTDTQRQARAETLLHEMAHMWFGNLVTMRWWNDLWLNESFATYMSYLALTNNTRFTDAWTNFNSAIKTWAYRQDQLVTTHPIAGQVADTDATFLNFDGITYGKGASVLKQLAATIGPDAFREGMRRYFRRYAYGNATLTQFLDALGEGTGRDLQAWARSWLETPSLNTLGAEWQADGDRVARLALTQTAPPEYPTLRPHTAEIGLVRDTGSDRPVVESIGATIDGAEAEVEEARGKPAPAMVFPNFNDHAYAKIALDPTSLAWVRSNLERIDDPLFRSLLWGALWDMTRDQKLRSTDFVELASDKVRHEHDLELVEAIIQRILVALGRYVPDDRREELFHRFFEAAWERLQAAPEGDAQITWARAVVGSAISRDDLAHVRRLADGEMSVPGLTIDQDMRWDMALRGVALGVEGAQERMEAERERDPSDRGQRMMIRAETARPSAGAKEAAWERIHGDGYGSLHLTGAAMGGFNWYAQRDLLAPYVERFFDTVEGTFAERDKEFLSSYFANLFPGYRVDHEVLDRSRRLLERVQDEPGQVLLTRMLREANDDLERALKCREFAASGG